MQYIKKIKLAKNGRWEIGKNKKGRKGIKITNRERKRKEGR